VELLQEQAGGQEPARVPTLRQNAEKQVAASQGYDIPPYPKFTDFKTWDEEGPPKGSISHYPIKGGDQVAGVVCSPAPPVDRRPDLGGVDSGPHDRPAFPGRADGQDARLGRSRTRRLQANLMVSKAGCQPGSSSLGGNS